MDTYLNNLLIRRIAMVSVLLGGIYCLFLGLQTNETSVVSLFYLLTGISAIYLSIQKETWSPQNGPMLLPLDASFKTADEKSGKTIQVCHPPLKNLKGIIYWLSEDDHQSYYLSADADKDCIDIRVPEKSANIYYRLVFSDGLISKVNQALSTP